MILFPPAKINIGLRITARRPDGYHDLETLFFPIPLCDALEIVPSREPTRLDEGGSPSCDPEDNLVMRAYQLLRSRHPARVGEVELILRKRIPSGAGLGGGSSDAAATLLLLDRLFALGNSVEELRALGKELGADVPFFISATPHLARGIGELLTPFALDLSGWYLLLVLPDIHISTRDAYRRVEPCVPDVSLNELLQAPVEEWRQGVTNDFEPSVFEQYPQLARLKERLYAAGAVYASMSGSGSAFYALARQPIQSQDLVLPVGYKTYAYQL